jgi:serine/threonine-protein kinase
LSDKFQLTGRHAEGAICEVFKAHHVALDIAVAVKVLKPEYTGDPRFLERMRIEAQVLPRLRSPHIVHCFDRGVTEDGRPFTVLEFLRGDTLESLLATVGKFDELVTVEIGAALLEALSVAHTRGIVHRDVSLRNLIIHRTEHEPPTLKLIDFGFAWITPDAPESAPEPAETPDHDLAVGTPRFTSPEVALGHGAIDGRSDLYSTGIVLYTLLAGRDPFAEFETSDSVLEAHAHCPAPPISDYARTISKPVEHVVMRLLEKNPARRYPTASEAADALLKAGDVARHSGTTAPSRPPSPSSRRPFVEMPNATGPTTAPSALRELPLIRANDAQHLVATWDNVFIQIWHTEVTTHAVAGITEAARALVAEKRDVPLAILFIVEPSSPPPSERVRVLMSSFFHNLSPNFTHRLVVAEGSSFRMALVRCVGIDVSSLAPEPIPFIFANSIRQAADIVEPILSSKSGGAAGLVRAIMSVRDPTRIAEDRSVLDAERFAG